MKKDSINNPNFESILW